ncbi:ABC transporter C-terminal domain-containing protein [Natronorubrum halalkaliphilum]|uniref:ABC transporter C-terminal domain-containing protein n=1 Tax=Natronorubrum halalkaliphilum TaxID=2691917 RepID=UPI001916B50A|nr:ABC transporter C-terminal domain-containing protein [Natronorubrum halalkaliphilum]
MTTTRLVVLLVLVTTVGLTVAPVASGAVADALVDTDDAGDGASETNTTVSTFMQSSAADTENAVESGMFDAKYNAAEDDEQGDMVVDRTATLENRLDELEAEREALNESGDDLHPGEYQARLAKLGAEIRSLETELDKTEQRAVETGVDDERLANLQSNASNLTGSEVAQLARGLAGGNGTPGGPPDDPGNQSAGNGQGQGQGHASGPPGNANGPSDGDSGNSSHPGSGSGNGPPGDGSDDDSNPGAGSGNGPPGDDSDDDSNPGSGSGNGPPGDGSDDDSNPGSGSGNGPDSDTQ